MMKKFYKKEIIVVLVLLLVAVAPLVLQKGEPVKSSSADARLVVMTPHNETIRREFGEAFAEYWEKETGQKLFIDWRTPGGTSEIRIVLDGKFSRAEKKNEKGIGVDVLFGGGSYMFQKMESQGRLVKLDIFEKKKDWFGGDFGIRQTFTGEQCYSKDHQWVGVCLSSFGICYNVDRLERLGIEAPSTWDDLGDPRYYGQLAIADPMKSGSVAKAFEMLIQQKIRHALDTVQREPGESREQMLERATGQGWTKGLQLIQRISANARYFTDKASKIPHDVAQGDAAAGMCVDFYGRTYNEKLKKADGTSRLVWISPKGGTSQSVDPVAVMRGAPNNQIAQSFVEFLLSDRGQLIWNSKPGTQNGSKYQALRRLPVRPGVYTPEHLKHFTDPEVMPYEGVPDFVYEPGLTAELFHALRYAIKVMCIDTHDELTEAWGVLIESGVMIESMGEDQKISSKALRNFNEVRLFSYRKAFELKRLLDKKVNKEGSLRLLDKMNRLAANFRRSYEDSQKLARKKE